MKTTRNCMDLSARGAVLPYVAGTLSDAETEAFESHLITCDRCQAEVRLATAVRAEVQGLSAPSATPRRARRLAAAGGVVAAAAAVVLLLVGPESPIPEPSEHRAVIEEVIAPAPIFPVGRVESFREARWTGLAGARSYRLTLVDSDGALIWEELTADTFLVVPPTISLETERAYFWRVEAQTALDRWTGSDFERFELTPSTSPPR